MKNLLNEEARRSILVYTSSGVLIAVCYLLLKDLSSAKKAFDTLCAALSPFIWGIGITLVVRPIRISLEKNVLSQLKMKDRMKRRISVLASLFLLLFVIVLFFVLLTPQIISSVNSFINSMDTYANEIREFILKFDADGDVAKLIDSIYQNLKKTALDNIGQIGSILPTVIDTSVSVAKGFFNFLIGLIVSLYLLLEEERWHRQCKKLIYAVLPEIHAERIVYVTQLMMGMFNDFLFGKAVDSLIVGILAGVVCSILRIPYASLIGVVVGLTNMIPVFGPFIGAVPCVIILLLINPAKALEFIVFIVILQQIDGNIIGPAILGDSMGLHALWIMFAIIVGGALYGVVGMFLGVPLFATIYKLVQDSVEGTLKRKQIRIH